jgi:hypothetical protein
MSRLALVGALVWPGVAGAALLGCHDKLAITPDPIQVAGRPQVMTVTVKYPNDLVCGLLTFLSALLLGSETDTAWITRTVADPGGTGPWINTSNNNNPNKNQLLSASPTPITLNFNNGTASFYLNTNDVGQYDLTLEVKLCSLLCLTGSDWTGSASITTRPFGLGITAIRKGATANPGGTAPGDPIFAKAGENFQATVGAYLYPSTQAQQNRQDGDNDGIPDRGSDITGNGLAQHFAWPVTLSGDAPYTPSNGVQGQVGGGSIALAAFSGGQATVTGLSYGEVGSFTLRAQATNYLNASGTNIVSAPATPIVGRFIPDHFGLTGSVVTRSDLQSTEGQTVPFTYLDEPMLATLLVTAYNAADGPTKNYAGSFAKLDAATLGTGTNWFNTGCAAGTQCMGLGAVNAATGLSGRLSIVTHAANPAVSDPASSWNAGVGTFTAHVALARPTTTTPDGTWGPYEALKIGAVPLDSDGVTLPAPASPDTHKVDLDATTGNTLASNPDGTAERKLAFTTKARFGRLRLLNAHGSELLRLPVPLFAEYWNGSGFLKNRDDSCTKIAVSDLVLTKVLASAGSTTASLGSVHAPCNGTLWSSDGRLVLSPPGAGHSGYVDLTLTAPTYLQYNWKGSVGNPTARARFGVYKNSNEFVYMRENY